jgi:hypothetical protein
MSKNNKESENIANEHYKEYYKPCCGEIKKVNEQESLYKSICEMYEKDDSENYLTTKGNNLLCKAKKVGIAILVIIGILTVLSIKKTVDNIEARMHNASSVITK